MQFDSCYSDSLLGLYCMSDTARGYANMPYIKLRTDVDPTAAIFRLCIYANESESSSFFASECNEILKRHLCVGSRNLEETISHVKHVVNQLFPSNSIERDRRFLCDLQKGIEKVYEHNRGKMRTMRFKKNVQDWIFDVEKGNRTHCDCTCLKNKKIEWKEEDFEFMFHIFQAADFLTDKTALMKQLEGFIKNKEETIRLDSPKDACILC